MKTPLVTDCKWERTILIVTTLLNSSPVLFPAIVFDHGACSVGYGVDK